MFILKSTIVTDTALVKRAHRIPLATAKSGGNVCRRSGLAWKRR